jgi:hypothetical protein
MFFGYNTVKADVQQGKENEVSVLVTFFVLALQPSAGYDLLVHAVS